MDGSGEVRLPQRHVTELSSFFAAHDRWLFGHAFLRTRGDRELAADLVQDTFEAAARAWTRLRRRAAGQQRAWLLGTLELPRVFRTGNIRLIHAASCPFRYWSMTSCGVR